MTSPAAGTTNPAHRQSRWRIVAYLFTSILLLCVAGIAGLYLIAHAALPQVDGSLAVTGLNSRVTVRRDLRGVPTIEAENLHDLFVAQGYVTAQDRLWQLDSMRRFAAGELSEILGEEFVSHDREQRILGLREAARLSLEVSTVAERANIHAYAQGISAFIESHRNRLPLEFRILRYQPRSWADEDCMLIAAQMVKDLNHYEYRESLTREKILAKLGPELTGDLYVNVSSADHPPTASRIGNPIQIQEKIEDGVVLPNLAIIGREATSDEPRALGSNNWVISGAHSVTGKPLLSNDMHLGHQVPNLWYQAHLRSGSFDVAGVTLPGLPYVIVGHNQRIAWGFTNIGPTVEDVYIETFNSNGEYLTPDGWKPAQHRREVIHVKNKPDAVLDVVSTRHGPIITGLVPGETRQLALRWTLHDGTRNPFFDLNSAQNWDEFRMALSRLDAPGQNVVYADVDGNIGYQATGKVPIRPGDGSLPVSGADSAHDWTGFIAYDQMPRVFNPPAGVIATANSRISPNGYAHSISTGWEAPWRSARIYQVLESGQKFSAADMLALQTDIYSGLDHFVAERIARAVSKSNKPSEAAKSAAETLRSWDGRMTLNSSAAAIEFEARSELVRMLLEPKLGSTSSPNWKSYHWGMQTVWLKNVLEQEPKRWLPYSFANYNDLLTAALETALKKQSSWNWGSSHPVAIQHPILGQIPLLRCWTGPGVQAQAGSGLTVKAVTRSHGPSERLTVDLSDLDNSTLNLVTGESGNFLSPNYMDQWQAWYEGFTFPFPFSTAAVDKSTAHTLVLQPK
jgi:penicillin amidase